MMAHVCLRFLHTVSLTNGNQRDVTRCDKYQVGRAAARARAVSRHFYGSLVHLPTQVFAELHALGHHAAKVRVPGASAESAYN